MNSYISYITDPIDGKNDGGKGKNLKFLASNNIDVPNGIIISAEFYKNYYKNPPQFNFNDDSILEQQSNNFYKEVLKKNLPEEFIHEIQSKILKLGEDNNYAVRSSSTFEDLEGAAFAGQHDTFLNINIDKIEKNIRKCFASLWKKNAILYRRNAGFEQKEASMAVVIQKMIYADSAGVAFSVNPVSGRMEHVLIEGNWGIGESVVEGESLTDNWIVDVNKNSIYEKNIAKKNFQYIADFNGLKKIVLNKKQSIQSCLSDEQILFLADQVKKLEKIYRKPQDIEWVFKNKKFYIVQSRPQTTIPPIFTRDESAERFPDPLTPLTWSYVEEAFNNSLEYSLKLMNINLPTRPWFDLKNHYVYGNQNAVKILAQFRPINFSNLNDLIKEIPTIRDRYKWVIDLPNIWMRDLDKYLIRIGYMMNENIEAMNSEKTQLYLDKLFKLANDYFKPNIAISMTQAFLSNTLLYIINKIVGNKLKAHDILKKIISASETKTGQINNEIFEMAKIVRSDKKIMNELKHGGKKFLLISEKFPHFMKIFNKFIKNYGHREISFDYYIPTWMESPHIVLDMIYLTATSDMNDDPWKKYQDIRKIQMESTQILYNNSPESIHFFLHELIRLCLDFTFLDDLEHFQTTRLNLLARKSIGIIGEKIQKNSDLNDPYDLFFLKKDELEQISNFKLDENTIKKIYYRKKQYLNAFKEEPNWELNNIEKPINSDKNIFFGTPGSPGEFEGQVYLVNGVEDFSGLPNDSILIAKTTNPAWTVLFYKAKAVITESGGPLSHGAVTARELGLPAVMSVRGCMNIFSNGELVRINGTKGFVEKLN